MRQPRDPFGKVYMAESPQAGRHPVIILSREPLNRADYARAVGVVGVSR